MDDRNDKLESFVWLSIDVSPLCISHVLFENEIWQRLMCMYEARLRWRPEAPGGGGGVRDQQ